ncbi:MAG TPA: MMPL family transporter, partial [Aeromicrobium sp.]|nr:MMPL family transporter [Aeromicrobium sp.]
MNRQIAGWITHRWAKWLILIVSLGAIGGLGMLGSKLTSVQENDIAAWLPGDAESTLALQKAQKFSDPDAVPAILVYVNEAGLSEADMATIGADTAQLADVESVREVSPPIPSQDGKAAQVVVTMHLSSDGWEDLPDLVEQMRAIVTDDAGDLSAVVGGPAAFGADQASAFAGIDGILLAAALGIVFVVLLLTYRSIVIPVTFLLCAVGALGIAQGVVYLLAKHADLTVNGQSAGILSILVIGAGVDYALLLVARYREELRNYQDRHEAMAHALHRAAPAILASGATVIIGLLCLTFAQMNSTAGLGPV